MTDFLATANETADRLLAQFAQGQETLVSTLTHLTDAATSLQAVKLPELSLPSPRDVTAAAFGVAESVVEQQKRFAERLFEVTDTATEKTTAKASAKTSAKA